MPYLWEPWQELVPMRNISAPAGDDRASQVVVNLAAVLQGSSGASQCPEQAAMEQLVKMARQGPRSTRAQMPEGCISAV